MRLSLAACRRSRRRLCRQLGQRRGGAGDPPRGRSEDPARRRHPRPRRDRRTGSISASTASCSAPRRCAIPIWCAAPPPTIPAASSSASTRATARSRSKAGPRPARSARRPGASLRRCRRRGDRLHRHRPRRRAGRRRCRRASPASPRQVGMPVIASGGVAVARRHRGAEGARAGRHRRRDHRPRAL